MHILYLEMSSSLDTFGFRIPSFVDHRPSGMVATALGILSVLMSPGFHSAHLRCWTGNAGNGSFDMVYPMVNKHRP